MQRLPIPSLALLMLAAGCTSGGDGGRDAGIDGHAGLPQQLPFTLSRTDVGDPLSDDEIAAFTRKITGFWKEVDYFGWTSWHSHGLHPSYDPDMPGYKMWWQDTVAIKQGDTVIFEHRGGADNIMIRTPKVLNQAIAGCLTSGEPVLCALAGDYCKGMVALFQGMLWGNEDPPVESIMARAIFTHDHAYTTKDGRKVEVDYDPVKQEKYDWNAHTVPNPDNPVFGSIWVRNMRSKDDVPHLYRSVPLLMRLIENAPDPGLQETARDALVHLQAFARDIVDSGYLIRTREDGETFVPTKEGDPDSIADLACFVCYDAVLPDAECNPKLASALIAYGEPLDNECDEGISREYEMVATSGHYFNYAIVRYFHLAAITNALIIRKDDVARRLLDGLITRVDEMEADQDERNDHPEWDADMASYLLASAASGLPLTSREARIIQQRYGLAVDHYLAWEYWDLYAPSIPDGTYDYKPSRDAADTKHVRPEEMAYLLEYCYSPWRNPAGVEVVDCGVVLDPSRWGE